MNILICDDSKIARNSLAKKIPNSSSLRLFYAQDGKEGLEVLRANPIDILFLDLTMPVMDGFQVLASLQDNPHPAHIIVVSGDIQAQAKERCFQLGVSDFIEKPFAQDEMEIIFSKYHIPTPQVSYSKFETTSDDVIETIKEISNIALGSSAALISEQFGHFIEMPLPTVASLHHSELIMTLQDIVNHSEYKAISQRFVGEGLYGEALVCLHGSGLEQLIQVNNDHSVTANETILNIANLLVSSFLLSFSAQLNINVSLRQPSALDPEQLKASLKESNDYLADYDNDIFTIEFIYTTKTSDLKCDVIFLMDNDSLTSITTILESLL